MAAHRDVLNLVPRNPDAHNNLGACLEEIGRLEEAAECYRQAMRLRPAFYQAFTNLGHVLMRMGDLAGAESACCRAVAIRGDYAPAYTVLGTVLAEQLRLDGAIASYRKAISLDPNCAPAHLNLGLALLQTGDFANGWNEANWDYRRTPIPAWTRNLWDGRASLRGRSILLRSGGGLGDVIHFARYVTILARQGARVIVECPSQLVELMATVEGVAQVVATGWTFFEQFDFYSPLPALPMLVNTELYTIPTAMPYFHPSAKLVEQWREPIAKVPGFGVGVCWHGDQRVPNLRARSFPPAELKALAAIPGVTLVNLQHGIQPPSDLPLKTLPGLEPHKMRLVDVAAVMKHLDLIVTCDTSIAHLAGALAVPVWVALKYASCWRWLLDRTDSPWYPTMRLFRQPRIGDWTSVFQSMAHELRTDMHYREGRP